MTSDYFSDNESFIMSQPLPSPASTPYTSRSRRTSRFDMPGSMDSGSVPLPPDLRVKIDDTANDDGVSILNTCRFTPTLHANLVSEILNLRRELDSKHKLVEELETNLQSECNENESLAKQLTSAVKDNKAAKRQLQFLEGETVAALEEIAGERDENKELNTELRNKLDAAQKKSRSIEEDSARVHSMLAREKDAWAEDKRALERRVHVSETRLKLLIDEIASQEAADEDAARQDNMDKMTKDYGLDVESDTASICSSPQRRPSTRNRRHSRNRSNGSYRSIGRNYHLSTISTDGQGWTNRVCLADELVFDEEAEDVDELEDDADDYPEHERRARKALESRQSNYPDEKAKRVLGLSSEYPPIARDGLVTSVNPEAQEQTRPPIYDLEQQSVMRPRREYTLVFPSSRPNYVDTGVQPSPPPSPELPVMREAWSQTVGLVPEAKSEEDSPSVVEIEAYQRCTTVSIPQSPVSPTNFGSPYNPASTIPVHGKQPLSPPETPKVPSGMDRSIPLPDLQLLDFRPECVSSSTQTMATDEQDTLPSKNKRAASPAAISIPSIAIHAPTSAPSSPKEPILPPGTKSMSTQTTGEFASPMYSRGMQTEPIRIDKRPVKLPAHLLPSTISSKPGTPEPQVCEDVRSPERKDSYQPSSSDSEPSVTKQATRHDFLSLLERAADEKAENRYPGNNDNGPLSLNQQEAIFSRPFRTSSLFAGFDGPSSDEEDNDDEVHSEKPGSQHHSISMVSSRNARVGRPVNPPTTVPEDKETTPQGSPQALASKRSSYEKLYKVGKPARNSIAKAPSMRRSAMIQNGTAAQMFVQKPPFPVPMRSSSYNKPFSKSEGSQSPTSRYGSPSGRRSHGVKPQRKDSLRKVRSATSRARASRSRSRSPPPLDSFSITEGNSLPHSPSDLISVNMFGHRRQRSTATVHTTDYSVSSASTQTNVVDAIASAMIGEFMWKYVRKRKAFGGPDTPVEVARAAEEASLASHGVRHKRWVWISPYERAIMWSSKQPTTGLALMGKSGRKLTIQSVLDVADTCPLPKNEVLFNRSILILTPARALKFTAVSRERHHLWLTALSFLAHSSSPIPDLSTMPPAPPPFEECPAQSQSKGAILRRSRVQDSVRLAKGKMNPVMARYAAQNESVPSMRSFDPIERIMPASPPAIPRGSWHGRKRSSTGPSAPPPTVPYRSFSHQHVASIYSNGSSDMYSAASPPSVPSSIYNPIPTTGIMSSRASEVSVSTRHHFFDTMGTVRMEAFIDNALGDSKQMTTAGVKARVERCRRSSQWSASTRSNRAGGFFEDLDANDPFRNF